MDDPVVLAATAVSLIMIPLLSYGCSKMKRWYAFIPPFVSMAFALPLFLFVMIVPTLDISYLLFVISTSVWTGGFFGIFCSMIIYKYYTRM